LRNYVEAMGGNLRLVAEFPDQPPVMLTGFADKHRPGLSASPSWRFQVTVKNLPPMIRAPSVATLDPFSPPFLDQP